MAENIRTWIFCPDTDSRQQKRPQLMDKYEAGKPRKWKKGTWAKWNCVTADFCYEMGAFVRQFAGCCIPWCYLLHVNREFQRALNNACAGWFLPIGGLAWRLAPAAEIRPNPIQIRFIWWALSLTLSSFIKTAHSAYQILPQVDGSHDLIPLMLVFCRASSLSALWWQQKKVELAADGMRGQTSWKPEMSQQWFNQPA